VLQMWPLSRATPTGQVSLACVGAGAGEAWMPPRAAKQQRSLQMWPLSKDAMRQVVLMLSQACGHHQGQKEH
jgi:hypothetical protein